MQGDANALVQNKDVEGQTLAFLHAWMPASLMDRMMQMTQAIMKYVLVGSAAPESRFPHLPGAHLLPAQRGTPALAFVRTICHVLALDAAVADDVRRPSLSTC